ncbi:MULTISPECIES: TIGR04222 domain-containing membrane protein [unclassified Streptomyces]|uniref:TIGR04222 domain-containing membrane protein n=1 Tax=unclassified Streptomyces TaxID=2593676 RepID=UPI0037F535BF
MFWVPLLLLAWIAAGAACTRLCLAAVRAAAVDPGAEPDARAPGLTLYEAAFLSGGPRRVADLTMVSMARQRRLLLAGTGWVTVVDPHGRDAIERSVIGAIGPEGQRRIAPARDAAASAEAVGSLGERLVGAGLAVPVDGRDGIAAGVLGVRYAAGAVLALGSTALLLPGGPDLARGLVALWFTLPLVLTLGCLAIARVEIHPYARWASPAGQRLLGSLARRARPCDDRTYLTSVAVRGVRAVRDPELRAAFGHREPAGRERHAGGA